MTTRPGNTVLLSKRAPVVLLAATLVGAGIFAVFHTDSPASADAVPPAPAPLQTNEAPASDMQGTAPMLPPGHPTIGHGADPLAPGAPMAEEPGAAALTWTVPPSWKTAPNASTMRLATYRIPHAAGDSDDAELSVVRAGGSTDANIERWVGQFDGAGADTRKVETVRGLRVTIVEVKGTFTGGMSKDNAASSHPGWALLAAIVETAGTPYFFKMTGPAKTVTAARPAFDALVASFTPTAS